MRLPWTIWRFTAGELWKLLLLTTAVVVVVAAFAATVKPMAEGKLGPAEAARFLLLAVPPMLQYVLPFAACFGATLAFHRMAADNELDAARCGGIGFGRLLVPAWATGIVLAAVLAALSGEVVPRFLRLMEEVLREDLPRALERAVDRGEPVMFADTVIYADRVDRLGPDESAGAYEVLVLSRVGVLFTGQDGAVRGEVTAGRAWVWLQPGSGDASTFATVRLERASGHLPGARISGDEYTFSRAVPSAFRDDVKFMSWSRLAKLPSNPDLHGAIESRRRTLAYTIAREEFLAAIDAELRTHGQARLTDESGRRFLVRGSGLERRDDRWIIRPASAGGRVELEIRAEGAAEGGLRRVEADAAHLTSQAADDMLSRRLSLRLHLEQVRVLDGASESGTPPVLIREQSFGGLSPSANPLPGLLSMPSRDLIAESDRRVRAGPNPAISESASDLRRRLRRLTSELVARVNEQAAMSISCLVMVLTGSVTAIRLKTRLPMPVYLWSFFPGLGAVLTVNAGKELAVTMGPPGYVVMWGGIGLLALYSAAVFGSFRRH